MKIQVISLFPKVFEEYFSTSMLRKAAEAGLFEYELVDLRGFGVGPRKQVDDTPAGGGDGMVLMVEPVVAAIEKCKESSPNAKVLAMTPRGQTFKQSDAQGLADEGRDLIIICGRYEGFDERIMDWVDEEISIGNYVLTGGELPAMVVADAVVRLIPGVLGGDQSAEDESFSDDKTREHPQYTKPAEFRGKKIPDVLLSGDHAKIAKWREENKS
ncbi:MAG: tRNA (guanosine(37)-N1)-methyltransferase TrmD [Patescibacteria group bacterium]